MRFAAIGPLDCGRATDAAEILGAFARTLVLALPALFGACANSGMAGREVAKAEPASVEPMRLMVRFEPVRSAGLDPAEREKRESRAVASAQACEKPYAGRLATLLSGGAEVVRSSRSIDVLASLPTQIRVLDRDFVQCLRSAGGTGYSYVASRGGHEERIPQYITRVAAPLLDDEETHTGSPDERQRAGAELLSTLAEIVRTGAEINSGQAQAAPASEEGAAPSRRSPQMSISP
jgi:hypothetical protein